MLAEQQGGGVKVSSTHTGNANSRQSRAGTTERGVGEAPTAYSSGKLQYSCSGNGRGEGAGEDKLVEIQEMGANPARLQPTIVLVTKTDPEHGPWSKELQAETETIAVRRSFRFTHVINVNVLKYLLCKLSLS